MKETFEKLELIAKQFESGNYSIEELQSRLETILASNEISAILIEVTNELEEIRFTKLEENQRNYAIVALDRMFTKIKNL